MFIATTRVYFTQCAQLFVRHTVQIDVEVPRLVEIFRPLRHGELKRIHLDGNRLHTSNHRRCSPSGRLRLHMSTKSTISHVGPFKNKRLETERTAPCYVRQETPSCSKLLDRNFFGGQEVAGVTRLQIQINWSHRA